MPFTDSSHVIQSHRERERCREGGLTSIFPGLAEELKVGESLMENPQVNNFLNVLPCSDKVLFMMHESAFLCSIHPRNQSTWMCYLCTTAYNCFIYSNIKKLLCGRGHLILIWLCWEPSKWRNSLIPCGAHWHDAKVQVPVGTRCHARVLRLGPGKCCLITGIQCTLSLRSFPHQNMIVQVNPHQKVTYFISNKYACVQNWRLFNLTLYTSIRKLTNAKK